MNIKISKKLIHHLAVIATLTALFSTSCSKKTTGTQAAHDHDSASEHEQGHHHDDSNHHDDDTEHNDGEKSEGGPNGGRLIISVEPAVEFVVEDDRSVRIYLFDENRKEVTPTNQIITLIGGERTNPTTIAFTKKGNRLVSDKPLPLGNSIPVVLQIMTSPNAETVREKFNVNLSECPTCHYQEYACVCGHDDH